MEKGEKSWYLWTGEVALLAQCLPNMHKTQQCISQIRWLVCAISAPGKWKQRDQGFKVVIGTLQCEFKGSLEYTKPILQK